MCVCADVCVCVLVSEHAPVCIGTLQCEMQSGINTNHTDILLPTSTAATTTTSLSPPSEKFMFYYPIKYESQFIRSHLKFQVTAHAFPNTFGSVAGVYFWSLTCLLMELACKCEKERKGRQ